MPRQARLDAPGVLHHVMARGIERRKIYSDDRDREDFVRRLTELYEKGAWVIYAWALMPNHFHLLVRTGKQSLSRNMRSLSHRKGDRLVFRGMKEGEGDSAENTEG